MRNLELETEIMKNIKELKEDTVREVLDFILFLKHRQKENSVDLEFKGGKDSNNLLLKLGNGLFDGHDLPNDTASNHDKYLYGNSR